MDQTTGHRQLDSVLYFILRANTAALSYGLGETYMPAGQMKADAQYFAILAGAGITVFVSTGDGGSSPGPSGYGDTSGPLQVESPADDPNVTAVGGTSLLLNTSSGAVNSESAWSLGGGGSSQVCSGHVFLRPAWQTGTGIPAGIDWYQTSHWRQIPASVAISF